jgi:hypothetical protein
MVLALVFIRTCPCPGVGTSKSFISTVLLPGRIAPFIIIFTAITFLSFRTFWRL